MARTGKAGDDIFASAAQPPKKPAARAAAEPEQVGEAGRGRGRPIAHEEPTTKATVVLYNRQIAQLDTIAAEIRGRTGRVLSRADFVRAILDAVQDAGVDLSSAVSEADIRRLVAAKFRAK